MFKVRSLQLILTVLVILGISAGPAAAQDGGPGKAATDLGTAFTYQGQLKNGSGNPVTATCGFNFSLWDSLSGGSQIGSTVPKTGVAVTNGYFTVSLDFGAGAFHGNARWLEIAVSCPAGGSYVTLNPRQPLTAAPYAIYALNAGSAQNADLLDGYHATAFQQHYQNVRVVAKSGGDYTTITDALNSITTASATNPYLIYVAPGVYTEQVFMKPYVDIEGAGELVTKITYTGNFSSAGTVLGADNAELRFLAVENTGGVGAAIAIYNDGASPRITHVTATASGGNPIAAGVGNYDYSNPTMTNVTATASGGTNTAGVYNNYSSPIMTSVLAFASGATYDNSGVLNDNSSPTMMGVKASASGGSSRNNFGIFNTSGSSPMLTNVTASASGGEYAYGVSNNGSSSMMIDVTVSASGGAYDYGVSNSGSSPTMIGVTANASVTTTTGTTVWGVYNTNSSPTMTNVNATASGGHSNYGVENDAGSNPVMTNVTAIATDGHESFGVLNNNSSATILNSQIGGSGASNNDGIVNYASSGTYTVKVNNSKIYGSTSTIYSGISGTGNYTTRIAASQIGGSGIVGGSGTYSYVCVGAFNDSYVALNATCH